MTGPQRAVRPGPSRKKRRCGLPEAPRITLRRVVSTAAAGAGSEQEFFGRLDQAGVLVRKRFSTRNPGEITGYAVALPHDTTRADTPVWFGGGKLAADLTLPKLRCRWDATGPRPGDWFTAAERSAIWEHAARTAAGAAEQIRNVAATDPAAAADAAWAAADTLHAAAAALGSRVLRQAADSYDRAARAPYGRIPVPGLPGNNLRRTARLLSTVTSVVPDAPLAETPDRPATPAQPPASLGHPAGDPLTSGTGRPDDGPGRGLHHDPHHRVHRPALGEAIGLERDYLHPGEIHVEWQLRELNGRFHRLPPKDDSYRSPAWEPSLPVDLPPFLTGLLTRQTQDHPHSQCGCAAQHGGSGRYLFLGPDGGHYRRSNYGRRVFRPACDGRHEASSGHPRKLVIADATTWPGVPIVAWPPAGPIP